MCFYRLQLSHHYPTSTWRSASETQQGFAQTGGIRHPQGVVPVGSALSAMFQKRREKMRGKREMCWLGEGIKRGLAVCRLASLCSVLPCPIPKPLLPSLHACLHYFLKYLLRWQACGFFFPSLFFFNASLQMNAYTAALSVALPNCCVLTSSRDIHYNNGSLAWMKAKQNASLH